MNDLPRAIAFKILPVVKIVDYTGTPEQAFARFSEQIAAWWPLATHSVARKADGVTVAFERLEIGGRFHVRWAMAGVWPARHWHQLGGSTNITPGSVE